MKTNRLTRTAIVISAALFLSAPFGHADDRTSTALSNARSFTLDSVKLGMTEQEFLRVYPNAQPLSDLTDTKTATKGLRVNETQNTDGIDAAFWNGKLIEFYAWYSAARTNEMGGFMILVDRMIDKFGKGDADSKGNTEIDGEWVSSQIKWKIDASAFYCEILVKTKITRINIADTAAYRERDKERGKKAVVGF